MAINYNNQFAVSVCNVYARDASTKKAVFAGKANISSTLTLAMTATDVRGGIGNNLLFKYMHDRVLTVEIVSATFQKQFLAINVGSDVNAVTNVITQTTECVDFVAGVGTMKGTSVSPTVAVFFDNGSGETVTPTTKTITLTDTSYNGQATIFYDTTIATSTEKISVNTSTAPKVLDLTLIGRIMDTDGVVTDLMTINIPKYQVEGNYDLSFSADGVSQDKITGSALANTGATCLEGDTYASVTFVKPTPIVTTAE